MEFYFTSTKPPPHKQFYSLKKILEGENKLEMNYEGKNTMSGSKLNFSITTDMYRQ